MGGKITLIKIDLSPEEVERYKLFCKYYKNVKIMLDKGVFDTKEGSVLMSFDQNGIIGSIKRENWLLR